jgi:hypothetical protein
MNLKEIEELLEKFYEGNTNLSDEQKLREFFSGNEIPPKLIEHADLFRFYSQSRKEQINDTEFEDRFNSAIQEHSSIPILPRKRQIYYISGIAAVLIILTGLIFTFKNDVLKQAVTKPVNAELAFKQATNALAMLSINFNAGLDQVQKLQNFQKGINELQKIQAFQKGIDEMTKFSKFYQYQQIVINPDDKNRP